VKLSGERLRQVVEAAGRRVLKAQQDDAIAVTWHADDCVVPNDTTGEKTRVYTGCDGVMVPIITDAEKIKRRDKVKAKRRRRGKKCKPLPPRRRGSDLSWKEFKVAFFYSEEAKRQHVAFTHGNHVAAGKLLRREADRLRFQQADERVGLVDGADVDSRGRCNCTSPSWTPWAWTSITSAKTCIARVARCLARIAGRQNMGRTN